MKVEYINKDSRELLYELIKDLQSDSIIYLARFPEPIGEMRYRDVLKKMFLDTGRCLAIVWLFFEEGVKKIYSFLIQTNLKEGNLDDILKLTGNVSGILIEETFSDRIYKVYKDAPFMDGKEILYYLEEVGNKYREREIKATLKIALKHDLG